MNPTQAIDIDPDVDPLGRQAIEILIQKQICGSIDYRKTTASTNTLALNDLTSRASKTDDRDEAKKPTPASDRSSLPKLFLTDRQTAGRGRRGRSWISSDAALTFSLMLPRWIPSQRENQLVSLAVGVGIAQFLEFELAPIHVQLKWPNDVHAGGGKVAGILIETLSTQPRCLVIGVGVNVGTAPELSFEDESEQPGQPARGLSEVVGRPLERYALLPGMLGSISEAIRNADSQPEQTITAFRERCLLTGKRIRFHEAGQPREGLCLGISSQGTLEVESSQGLRTLHSGEANLIRPQTT